MIKNLPTHTHAHTQTHRVHVVDGFESMRPIDVITQTDILRTLLANTCTRWW
jgi:CBS-domain-containing membrane protein